MIDLHLHILPGIDDGSRSMQESVEMARKLVALGFHGGFCTSHFIADSEQAADNQKKKLLREKLQKELDRAGVKFILLPGNEIYIDFEGKKGVRYQILFELPFYAEVPFLRDMIFELKARGITPILAHPERYLFLQKNPDVAVDLVKLGVKLQGNFGSIIGQYGGKAKKTLKILLKRHLISYLGTDIHRADGSLFLKFEKAQKKILKYAGEEYYRKMIKDGEELAGF